jgi:hypothetical protein
MCSYCSDPKTQKLCRWLALRVCLFGGEDDLITRLLKPASHTWSSSTRRNSSHVNCCVCLNLEIMFANQSDWAQPIKQVTNHQLCILSCAKSNITVQNRIFLWLWCSWSSSSFSSQLVWLFFFPRSNHAGAITSSLYSASWPLSRGANVHFTWESFVRTAEVLIFLYFFRSGSEHSIQSKKVQLRGGSHLPLCFVIRLRWAF